MVRARSDRKKKPPTTAQEDPYGVAVLLGMNLRSRHVYAGTVPAHVKARRRAANKRARIARRRAR